MFAKLIPNHQIGCVTELTVDRLQTLGLTALLLDVDGTLKPYLSKEPLPEVRQWLVDLRQAGIKVCLLSNGRGKRISKVAESLDLPYIALAMKPSPKGCRRALAEHKFDAATTGMVGDQIFADVLAGNRAGLTTILVTPIHPEQEPWFARVKRPFEKIVRTCLYR
ncbi:MAG: YqeG family HAD IIIA-type phosphatase [Planctomycetia bacterium]|nr:YqeG family HAD IIIA-type phosphatase [Planctomycetia bacterium]